MIVSYLLRCDICGTEVSTKSGMPPHWSSQIEEDGTERHACSEACRAKRDA